jgi:hypothetical protein
MYGENGKKGKSDKWRPKSEPNNARLCTSDGSRQSAIGWIHGLQKQNGYSSGDGKLGTGFGNDTKGGMQRL